MKKRNNIFELKDIVEKKEFGRNSRKSEGDKVKVKKKMNIFFKILLIIVTLPFFYFYPFYFIIKSKRLKKSHKWIASLVYLIPLYIFLNSVEGDTESDTVNSDSRLELIVKEVKIYQGQLFDPINYITDVNELSLDTIVIINNVDVNVPGEYTVIYKDNQTEKTLDVIVHEDPITLEESNISLELGDSFDPLKNVETKDIENNKIEINSNVDYSKPGIYTVIYRFDGIEKSINVKISEPNTAQYAFKNFEWLLTTTDSLGFLNNKVLEVDGGNISGSREPLVAVDVGFGNREYWAFTNQYGQLVAVIAETITLQDESTETLLGDGRYYEDDAKVPGTEESDLDEGHVIADACGGVSNAYNITPQNSTLNRYGNQAYMEDWIIKAGGASNFIAIITYPNTTTQIPSHYSYTYILNGDVVNDEFDNVKPESSISNSSKGNALVVIPPVTKSNDESQSSSGNDTNINGFVAIPPADESKDDSHSITEIDTNGNGIVTIKEAKAAGFKMPIRSDHWLYPYMVDGDGDGLVGESN